MTEPALCSCVTCRDEATAMRIVRVDAIRELALCEQEGGARQSVELALVEAAAPGDVVLVHAGVAIARLAPGDGG